jgi:hypothetical protein
VGRAVVQGFAVLPHQEKAVQKAARNLLGTSEGEAFLPNPEDNDV